MTPEGRVKEAVKKYLREIGAYWYMPVGMGYGAATVDFIGCYQGKFFAIETKAEGKKPTTRQKLCMSAIQAANGLAWVEESEELTETKYQFVKLGWRD